MSLIHNDISIVLICWNWVQTSSNTASLHYVNTSTWNRASSVIGGQFEQFWPGFGSVNTCLTEPDSTWPAWFVLQDQHSLVWFWPGTVQFNLECKHSIIISASTIMKGQYGSITALLVTYTVLYKIP